MKTKLGLAALLLVFSTCFCDSNSLYELARSAASQEDSLFNLHYTSVSYKSATLVWNAVPDAVNYRYFRSFTDDFATTGPIEVTGTEYTDSGLTPYTAYYFMVCAIYSDGREICSKTIFLRTPTLPQPANLRVDSITETSVSLAWDPVDGISTYSVHRGPDSMNFSTSGSIYTDNSVTTGTTYTYYVTCFDPVFGEGPASNIVTASPEFQFAPATSPSLAVSSMASTNLNLKWVTVAQATSYKLYRDTVAGGPFTDKVYEGPNNYYTDRGRASDTEYFYKVCAHNNAGDGPFSPEVPGKTTSDSFSAVGYSAVSAQTYSITQLKGGDAVKELPVGRLVYYKTVDGRFGIFEVQQLDPAINNDLMIRWKTWDGGAVYSGGEGLVIHGTWSCDLDLGTETISTPPADFQWVIQSTSERFINAVSGAGFFLP